MVAHELPDEILVRLRAADRLIDPSTRHSAPAPRRSPPREGGEDQHRRTRARHNNSNTHDALPLPESRNRSASVETTSRPTATSVELPSIRPQSEQLPAARQAQEWGRGRTQSDVVLTPVQDRSTEPQLPPAVLPELSPYPAQEAQDQHPRARTLRNPLQAQIGSPYEGLGNQETAPDMPYHSSHRW